MDDFNFVSGQRIPNEIIQLKKKFSYAITLWKNKTNALTKQKYTNIDTRIQHIELASKSNSWKKQLQIICIWCK